MPIFVSTQSEYDAVYRTRRYMGNEVVVQNCKDFINVKTDVTVGRNGRAVVDDKSTINITVKNNGIVTASGGKSKITGYDQANIIAKGNCKIKLNDEARANCFDNCHVTLRGFSQANADGKCSVFAYDQTLVSATGNVHVHSYQTSTATGSGISTINAQDNCVVYASEKCTVTAKDSCLVVADKFANIKAFDNCLVMSNHENPNVILTDKCEHVKLNEITEKNIIGIYRQVAQAQITALPTKRGLIIDEIEKYIPPERKPHFDKALKTKGLTDKRAKDKYIADHIEAAPIAKKTNAPPNFEQQLELARKTGRIQGVCECVVALGNNYEQGRELLHKMNVSQKDAQTYANKETFKAMEQGIYAQKQEQTFEQTQGVKR